MRWAGKERDRHRLWHLATPLTEVSELHHARLLLGVNRKEGKKEMRVLSVRNPTPVHAAAADLKAIIWQQSAGGEKSKQATDCWNLDNYVNTGRMSYKWARRKSSKEGKKWRNSKKKPDDKGHCISISNQNGQQRQIHRVLGRNSSKQKQKGKTFRVKQQKEM